MPTLAEAPVTSLTKMLLVGNSGAGKTGALASLAEAGYNIHLLDFDAGLDYLARKLSPEARARVTYETLVDKLKASPQGPIPVGQPTAFSRAMGLLNSWVPKLTASDVLVIDSLTFLSKAAYRYDDFLNPGAKDKRQIYFSAQQRVEALCAMLYDPSVACNVVVSTHITFVEIAEDIHRGYPAAIGKALSPQIPRYFNTCLLAEVVGVGPGAKRVLQTEPTGLIDVKHAVPAGLPRSLPIESGLATFFEAMKGEGA